MSGAQREASHGQVEEGCIGHGKEPVLRQRDKPKGWPFHTSLCRNLWLFVLQRLKIAAHFVLLEASSPSACRTGTAAAATAQRCATSRTRAPSTRWSSSWAPSHPTVSFDAGRGWGAGKIRSHRQAGDELAPRWAWVVVGGWGSESGVGGVWEGWIHSHGRRWWRGRGATGGWLQTSCRKSVCASPFSHPFPPFDLVVPSSHSSCIMLCLDAEVGHPPTRPAHRC